jgi:hypothetical protein
MPWAASRSLSGCCPSDWSDCGRAVLVPAAAIGLSFGDVSEIATIFGLVVPLLIAKTREAR